MRIRAVIAGLGFALMGGAAMAQDTVGAPPDRLQETYRDWMVRCATVTEAAGGAAGRICELSQELFEAESGQRVLSAVVRRDVDGAAALSLIAPFGLRLADGVGLVVDGSVLARIPFRTCLPQGCIATATLDAEALAGIAAATTAEVELVTDGGAALTLSLSLAGFTDGWGRLGAL